jgi:hypothetical protein
MFSSRSQPPAPFFVFPVAQVVEIPGVLLQLCLRHALPSFPAIVVGDHDLAYCRQRWLVSYLPTELTRDQLLAALSKEVLLYELLQTRQTHGMRSV